MSGFIGVPMMQDIKRLEYHIARLEKQLGDRIARLEQRIENQATNQ